MTANPMITNARWRSRDSSRADQGLATAATPRHYEIWYLYAQGYNPSLNQTINETLARNGTLTDADIERIYSMLRLAYPAHRGLEQSACRYGMRSSRSCR